MSEVLDVVVIGAGIAGLTAAYRLRHRRLLVLEAETRAGGRILSVPRPPYWLNLGAHMFGEPGTVIGDLVTELRLESRPINGRLLGISYRGRAALQERPESYPLVLPMSLAERISLVRVGVALRLGSARVVRELMRRPDGETPTARRQRLLEFEAHRTLADFVGPVHSETARILTAITERNGADPSEMSAGHALRSFANVWSATAPGRNLVGGSSDLPEALAQALGAHLELGARVLGLRNTANGVTVNYERNGVCHSVTARRAVLAVPALTAQAVAPDLPAATRQALSELRYGAYLTVAALTTETTAVPWENNYAISTPGLAFSVLFNQATTLRTVGARLRGGSIMMFRGARGAAKLLASSDEQIETLFLSDLEHTFPGSRRLIEEIVIQRWPEGAPYSFPGRAALQPALDADCGPIALAGDYLEFPNMEAAATTGVEAALKTEAALASG